MSAGSVLGLKCSGTWTLSLMIGAGGPLGTPLYLPRERLGSGIGDIDERDRNRSNHVGDSSNDRRCRCDRPFPDHHLRAAWHWMDLGARLCHRFRFDFRLLDLGCRRLSAAAGFFVFWHRWILLRRQGGGSFNAHLTS